MTIRKLAEFTGTSPTAVSLILNNRPHRYAAETVERVKQAAAKSQYVPSIYAQTMRTKRFHTVYVVKGARPGESTFNQVIERSFYDALAERGYRMGLAFLKDDTFGEPGFLRQIKRQWQCDGFVFAYNFPGPDTLRQQVAAEPFPCVWFNQKQRYDAVHPDNIEGGRRLATLMVEQGHRNLVFVQPSLVKGQMTHFSVADRVAGYRAVLEAQRYRPEVVSVPTELVGPPEQVPFFDAMLAKTPRATGWIFYSSGHLKSFVSAALRRGLVPPRDLSVATFGNAAEVWDTGFRVNYAIEYFDRMGTALADMLLAKINDPSRRIATRVIPMELREGCETVGPAPHR